MVSHVSSGFELAVMVCGGGLTEGRQSQIDGGSAAGGDVVHLGELVFGGGQIGFTAFGLAELTAVLGFFDAHREVQDDLGEVEFLGGIGAKERASQAPLTELTTMFRQFMVRFRLLALICPGDRIR